MSLILDMGSAIVFPMNKIKQLRTLKGLSQTDLAKECGVCRATIIAAEQGRVKTFKVAYALSKALELDVFDIIPNG